MRASTNIACFLFLSYVISATEQAQLPLVIATWGMTLNATRQAYKTLTTGSKDRLDALEDGINVCDLLKDCGVGIGPHDKPDERGEVTLDSMLMDGEDMTVGAVGCLRWVSNAIGVARAIIKYTDSTFLVGSDASEFAAQMGFMKENISLGNAEGDYQDWLDHDCQPNRWKQGAVTPDPKTSCGPYSPISTYMTKNRPQDQPRDQQRSRDSPRPYTLFDKTDHDTIGMVVVDDQGRVASGTSTNGLKHKIPGRVGDSPIAGAGSYAEKGVGAAATTGDGDIMMRMLPTFHAVALMRMGFTPQEAADLALSRVMDHYPEVGGALVVVTPAGEYGVSCSPLFGVFNYTIQSADMDTALVRTIPCLTTPLPRPTMPPAVVCGARRHLATPVTLLIWAVLYVCST